MISNNLKNKRLLIFGTGSVGSFYGGLLVKAGFDVTFLARGKTYEALKKNGLTLVIEGKRKNFPVNVIEAIRELPLQGIYDYIFLCVKSMNTKEAALTIKNYVGNAVISFQNGVGNEEIIGEVIGIEKVIGGLVFVAASTLEPGVVDQFGYSGGMIGELNCKITERILEIQKIFADSGVDFKISKDICADIWNKLVWNAAFNPLSVLTGKTLDRMLEENHELVKNIMTEVKNVAIAHGIKIRPDTVEFNLERSKGFSGFKTSMLQDYERAKPLEIEAILGVVIKKAEEKNIKVPNAERVYNEVKQKISNAKSKITI